MTSIEETLLHLPMRERAHLVSVLLDSLDLPSETEIEQRWLEEALRRSQEIDQGKVKLIGGEEFERQVEALFQ